MPSGECRRRLLRALLTVGLVLVVAALASAPGRALAAPATADAGSIGVTTPSKIFTGYQSSLVDACPMAYANRLSMTAQTDGKTETYNATAVVANADGTNPVTINVGQLGWSASNTGTAYGQDVWVNSCPSGATRIMKVTVTDANTGAVVLEYGGSNPCPDKDTTQIAGFVAGTEQLTVRYSGTATDPSPPIPAQGNGYDLRLTADTSGPVLATLTVADLVANTSPVSYFHAWTLASGVGVTAGVTLYAHDNTPSPTCPYDWTVYVGDGAVTPTDPGQNPTDPTDGKGGASSCSTFDVSCYIKAAFCWAFCPSTAAAQIHGFVTDVEAKPPWSYAATPPAFAAGLTSAVGQTGGHCPFTIGLPLGNGDTSGATAGGSDTVVDVCSALPPTSSPVIALRATANAALIIIFCWAMWNRIQAFIGVRQAAISAGDDTVSEIADDDDGGMRQGEANDVFDRAGDYDPSVDQS